VFYSQSIDTTVTTGFQPSGLNGEDPTKTYNFNDLGNTTISGGSNSKLGKTLLYFDFPTLWVIALTMQNRLGYCFY
jgi:hypothetical protein